MILLMGIPTTNKILILQRNLNFGLDYFTSHTFVKLLNLQPNNNEAKELKLPAGDLASINARIYIHKYDCSLN